MSDDHPLFELYRGPFEELPPLAVEHECRHGRIPFDGHDPCGCFPQDEHPELGTADRSHTRA